MALLHDSDEGEANRHATLSGFGLHFLPLGVEVKAVPTVTTRWCELMAAGAITFSSCFAIRFRRVFVTCFCSFG